MGYTTAADLAAGQIAMVGEARFTIEHEVVLNGLFNTHQLEKGEKSYYIPKYGTVTAKDLTDGVDMTESQQLTISGTTHTTDEAGCKVVITKKLAAQMNDDIMRSAGKIIGSAMKKKIETDGTALFSGLSSGVGAASTSFTIAYLQAAVTQLYGASEPAPDPIYCVLHPYTFHDIKGALGNPLTSSYTMPDDVVRSNLTGAWRGMEALFGIPVFICGNVDNSTTTSTYNAVFSKLCFMYLTGWEPETWNEYDGSLRGWEMGIVADYACVEEDDAYGRYLLFDASAPTS